MSSVMRAGCLLALLATAGCGHSPSASAGSAGSAPPTAPATNQPAPTAPTTTSPEPTDAVSNTEATDRHPQAARAFAARATAVADAWQRFLDTRTSPDPGTPQADSTPPGLAAPNWPDTVTGYGIEQVRTTTSRTNRPTLAFDLLTGVCENDVVARVWENDRVVVLGGTGRTQPGRICVAMVRAVPSTVSLRAPLGNRLVSDPFGRAYPVTRTGTR